MKGLLALEKWFWEWFFCSEQLDTWLLLCVFFSFLCSMNKRMLSFFYNAYYNTFLAYTYVSKFPDILCDLINSFSCALSGMPGGLRDVTYGSLWMYKVRAAHLPRLGWSGHVYSVPGRHWHALDWGNIIRPMHRWVRRVHAVAMILHLCCTLFYQYR